MDYANYSAFYDAEHAEYKEDVGFFVKQARKAGGPVLELGCGTGRVLFAVATAGVEVFGVDNCPQMLAEAHRKRDLYPETVRHKVHLFKASMETFDLGRRFNLIYLPFREFMHLMTVTSQLKTLAAIIRHLTPEGRVIINHYDIDLSALKQNSDDQPVVYRQRHDDFVDSQGQTVLVSASSLFDPVPQRLYEERIYETLDDHGRVTEKRYVFLTQRWFYRWEMHHLLERAGLRVVRLFGGFGREPYRQLGQEMVWVARLPTGAEVDEQLSRLKTLKTLLS